MKFIRDIINEKKQAGPGEQGDMEAATALRMPAAETAAYAPELDHDDAEDGFNLFEENPDEDGVQDLDAELVIDGTFAPEFDTELTPEPASDPAEALDLGGYEHAAPEPAPEPAVQPAPEPVMTAPVMPDMAAAGADMAPDPEMTQQILARRAVTRIPDAPAAPAGLPQGMEVPAPAAGRASRRAGRVKTRLLGFGSAQEAVSDPFAAAPATPNTDAAPGSPTQPVLYPVGWIVVTDGPGQGNAFTLFDGVSQIGRGEDQAIRLDFGDTSISRSNHAAIAYDAEQKSFFLGHGGKANLVRMNGRPVLSTEALSSGDQIRIGETSLRFVGLCGPDFDWTASRDEGEPRVSYA